MLLIVYPSDDLIQGRRKSDRSERNGRNHRFRLRWWSVSFGQIAVVRAEILPMVRLETGNQFLTTFSLHWLADIYFAHLRQFLFRDRSGKHHQWPREIRTVDPAQLVRPHHKRPDSPRARTPPTYMRRSQIHLPALH